jgi:nucleoside-diphosphate-sugar epimerase
VHLDDCVGICKALIEQERFGVTLNLCADEHPSRADFYQFQAQKYGLEPPTFLFENSNKKHKIIDNTLSKTLLNYAYKKPNPMDF